MPNTDSMCKCCLAGQSLKELWGQYLTEEGDLEVYGEMLTDCFVLSWLKPTNSTEYICDGCIDKLRDAYQFRKQIMAAKDILDNNLLDSTKDIIKEEIIITDIEIETKEESQEDDKRKVDSEQNEDDQNQDDGPDCSVPLRYEILKQTDEGRPSKRDCRGTVKYETIEDWFVNLEQTNELSDSDNQLEQTELKIKIKRESDTYSECETESSESEDDDDEESTDYTNEDDANYVSKNGFKWSKTELPRTSKTDDRTQESRPSKPVTFQSFLDLWSMVFDSEMIANVVLHTNVKLKAYRKQFHDSNRTELKDTNETEIRSLIGLFYYSSAFKCNNSDASYLFASDGTGYEIFRCVMSRFRFLTLISCLRFDSDGDRQNPLAAISSLLDKFITNSQLNYIPGPNVCVDEMLIRFSGQCKLVTYMSNKPAKYGIKILVLCDAESHYTYNAYLGYRKDSNSEDPSEAEKQLSIPEQSVLRVVKPIANSNRSITASSKFSSLKLMQSLKAQQLTYLGALKRSSPEVPKEFLPNKLRERGSSLYGFTEDYTLLSYVPKRNEAVILISSSHHAERIDEATNKPSMFVDYNRTKDGVIEIEKMCSVYSCARKPGSLPIAIFYRILDLTGINTFILHQSCSPKLRRKDFLLSLARDLVLSSLKERSYNDKLPRELRFTIRRVLGKDFPPPPVTVEVKGSSVRKVCSICPSKLKRRTRFNCCGCNSPICLQCSSQVCQDCKFSC